MLGYFTKWGDGGVDLLPLGALFKTQVRELAKFIGVPQKIAMKPSSPRLWIGHTAEAELGMSYEVIDPILYRLVDLRMSEQEVAKEVGTSLEIVRKVKKMIESSDHKRNMPPMAKI